MTALHGCPIRLNAFRAGQYNLLAKKERVDDLRFYCASRQLLQRLCVIRKLPAVALRQFFTVCDVVGLIVDQNDRSVLDLQTRRR